MHHDAASTGRPPMNGLRIRPMRPSAIRSRLSAPVQSEAGTMPANNGVRLDDRQRIANAMGIRDRPTSPRSPWQNGYAERLIGSIRRECVDHIIVLGERHLRHVLLSYMQYYNEVRTHLSLNKDAPVSRAVDRAGHILCRPILGGLHHQYVRM